MFSLCFISNFNCSTVMFFSMQLWVNNYVSRGRCLTTNEWIRTQTSSLQHNQKNKFENHQKRKEKNSDLQSEDEVEIFLCRSCLSHHPPQTCSCSSWWGEAVRLTIQSQSDYEQPAPTLTPPCRCVAGALAFLWCVSYGNGWSSASPAARPILHLCNHKNNKSPKMLFVRT